MKKYLLSEDKRGFNKSLYNSRIRAYAIRGLEDLAVIADLLPEDQLAEIFNKTTLSGFFKALLKIEVTTDKHENRKQKKETPIMLEKRKRLIEISYTILMLVGNLNFVAALMPSNWKPWLSGGYPPINNLRAIFHATQIE